MGLKDGDVYVLASHCLVLPGVPGKHSGHGRVVPRLVLDVVAAKLQGIPVRET